VILDTYCRLNKVLQLSIQNPLRSTHTHTHKRYLRFCNIYMILINKFVINHVTMDTEQCQIASFSESDIRYIKQLTVGTNLNVLVTYRICMFKDDQ